MRNFSNLFLE